jgi:flagellar hook assembly protein FlgD
LKIDQVINYPNPFSEFTTFTFNHTRPGDKLEINLEIFDLNGKIVQTYENTIESEIINSPFLVWYGDDLKGNKLRSGVYLYTLQVTDEDGNTSIQKQKLILMN